MSTTTTDPTGAPSEWAIVELLGHVRLAGRVSEHIVAGATLLRIDIPEVNIDRMRTVAGQRITEHRAIPAHSRSVPPSTLYAINWVSREAAELVAHVVAHEPITPFGVVQGLRAMHPSEREHHLLRWADQASEPAPAQGETRMVGGDDGHR